MKTTIITLATVLSLTLGAAVNTKAADKFDEANVTVLNDVKDIKKIEVRGNVELYVSNGVNDRVKVYNRYYAENAVVQNTNGTLHIASYSAKKLVVWVSVNNLNAIAAYDNAEIKSFGKLSAIDLNVDLHNAATAQLNVDSYSANVKVSDRAKANLSGQVTEYTITKGLSTTVNYANLVAFEAGNITTQPSAVRQNRNELATL